jgi:transcriptional regulator with XRE-family HTH domain
MTDDTPAAEPLDPDASALDRALALHLRGDDAAIELDREDRELFEALIPWLPAFVHAAGQAAFDAAQHPGEATEPIRPDDPVALMLGLVPDPQIVLDGRKLARTRKAAGLSLSDLVERLRERGWDVAEDEALHWEFGPTVLTPALLDSIAAELSVSRAAILTAGAPDPTPDLFQDPRVQSFLEEWAAEVDLRPDQLTARATKVLAAAAYRNRSEGSVDAFLGILRALRAIPGFLEKP